MKSKKHNILIIGAGSAGSVVAKKCAKNRDFFGTIHLTSRRIHKCEAVQKACETPIDISECNADDPKQVVTIIKKSNADIVINMALPYQDLSIMEACYQTKTHYLDTANYEPIDKAEFCYKWQWDLHEKFKTAGISALLGSGFDPGVTNVFCAYAQKHLFDTIDTIDIVDCNDGNHGKAFATNFNPEINIREITQAGKYYEDGKWNTIPAMSIKEEINFPEVGKRTGYLLYHEELESLAKHIPNVKRLRFWMTFSESYLTHLNVLQNVGMTAIEPISYEGKQIVPLQFLKAVLPDPGSLAENYSGKTCIGCIIEGKKDGKRKKIMIYNICEHDTCNTEVQAQAVSYTTGVPAMIGAMMVLSKKWSRSGVYNLEQYDPDPFMSALTEHGLPWKIITL